ncbi:MAG: hypothetical protein VW405_01355 [Rhodospirillaceae bacterium]
MQGNGDYRWWWGRGEVPERYEGPFSTRVEAIAAAEEALEPAEGYSICAADRALPTFGVFDADAVFEAFADRNEQVCDPEGDGYFEDVDPAGCAELEAALADAFMAWAAGREPRYWAFGDQRNEESREARAGLWCMNVLGPDDVYPVADYDTARRLSERFNAWWAAQPKLSDDDPLMLAVPAPWSWEAAAHADGLSATAENFGDWLKPEVADG